MKKRKKNKFKDFVNKHSGIEMYFLMGVGMFVFGIAEIIARFIYNPSINVSVASIVTGLIFMVLGWRHGPFKKIK